MNYRERALKQFAEMSNEELAAHCIIKSVVWGNYICKLDEKVFPQNTSYNEVLKYTINLLNRKE